MTTDWKPHYPRPAATQTTEPQTLLDAAEDAVIVFGMGWDLDGVMENLREAVKRADAMNETTLAEFFDGVVADVPDEEWRKMPTDFASQASSQTTDWLELAADAETIARWLDDDETDMAIFNLDVDVIIAKARHLAERLRGLGQ